MATAQIVPLSNQKRTRIINRYLDLSQQLAKIKTEMEMLKVEAIEILGEGAHETKSSRRSWSTRWIPATRSIPPSPNPKEANCEHRT